MSKYHYPAGAVDVIIKKDDKLLLIRRKNEPFKGLLAIPGGFVNEGEKVEDTAVREMMEEAQIYYSTNSNILGLYFDLEIHVQMPAELASFHRKNLGVKSEAET